MDINQIPTAVKWIASVLIAGFVAQFGKMLAEYLIRRYRQKRERKNEVSGDTDGQGSVPVPGETGDGRPSAHMDRESLADQAKAHKKLFKAEAKARKKGSK